MKNKDLEFLGSGRSRLEGSHENSSRSLSDAHAQLLIRTLQNLIF